MKTRTEHPIAPLAKAEIERFRAAVYAAASANPRTLPWREAIDPYRTLVSEVMLQQTQADRVTGKFVAFVSQFPTVAALASAELSELLKAWQGLGYNRRALALKRASEAIVERFGGIVPPNRKELESLPGIGPYTAGAIMAFAFDLPELFIETNIRSVFIHHFFQDRTGIHDRELLPLVAATLDRSRPRDWYNALMDYGVVLKRDHPNPSRKSIHHLRQSRFEGSNRQQRSALLRTILAQPGLSADDLATRVRGDREQIALNLARMEREGLMVCRRGRYFVRDRP
ncbi:HhH-GPD family protein [Geobacter argillaceus]|uniref:Adenine DNA glycosylase n=1 Tax=Geobacter argillaceus TaxID=345631 RepID=A0A562WUN1_9BACT|nr:A/G-specific adenine glycosylase [Geobacter argillaceus]TWJ33369.1 A/G-specific DNA-adenine glycosylase [Geobacter argillaceus]